MLGLRLKATKEVMILVIMLNGRLTPNLTHFPNKRVNGYAFWKSDNVRDMVVSHENL